MVQIKRKLKKRKKTRPLKRSKPLKKKAWDLYSRWIRMSAADEKGMCSCYTCGVVKHWKEMQAGHGVSGRGNAVLFDDRIVRVQCVSCNLFRFGNYQVFIPRLCREIGIDLYEEIERGKARVVKIPNSWYEDKIAWLSAEIKKMGQE